jgi:hypothetical protein
MGKSYFRPLYYHIVAPLANIKSFCDKKISKKINASGVGSVDW